MFGNRIRLNLEEPPHVARRELLVRAGIHRERGRDVEHRDARDRCGRVERHAVGHPAAAVVPGDEEALVPEAAHHRELIARHDARSVVRAAFAAVGFARIAVPAQVGQHDREPFRQPAGDLVPADVRLRMPVQQQQRRTAAAAQGMDRRAVDRDRRRGETGKEPSHYGPVCVGSVFTTTTAGPGAANARSSAPRRSATVSTVSACAPKPSAIAAMSGPRKSLAG